jgi:hypothetical protein
MVLPRLVADLKHWHYVTFRAVWRAADGCIRRC